MQHHVELVGVNDINKGAELMLHAVARQQADHLRGWTVSVAQDATSYEARARAGVRQRVWFDRLGPVGLRAGDLVPRRVREPLGLVAEREVSAILDASGFAYSDQQRREPFEARVAAYRRWRRQGKRIVLLPQAFGPFQTAATRRLGADLLSHVDLAFARDGDSFTALASLGTDTPVERAPDFTGLVHVEPTTAQRQRYGERVCVVPNFRMIDRVPAGAADAYREVLLAAFRELDRLGTEPFALIVNTKKDASLIASLSTSLGREIERVEPDDPLDVKRILGVCDLVVGSRFHGLVSSLAQGVPAVALGWSHKYPALMADYGCGDLLFDVGDPAALLDALSALLDPAERARRRADLLHRAAGLEAASHDMWRRVAGVLRR